MSSASSGSSAPPGEGRDYFQEAVPVLKSAMEAQQQFKRGDSSRGAEAVVYYERGIELLRQALASGRHTAIAEQLRKKVADTDKKLSSLRERIDADAVSAARTHHAGDLSSPATSLVAALEPPTTPTTTVGVGAALAAATAPGGETPLGSPAAPSSSPSLIRRQALRQATTARQELFEVVNSSSSSQPRRPAPPPELPWLAQTSAWTSFGGNGSLQPGGQQPGLELGAEALALAGGGSPWGTSQGAAAAGRGREVVAAGPSGLSRYSGGSSTPPSSPPPLRDGFSPRGGAGGAGFSRGSGASEVVRVREAAIAAAVDAATGQAERQTAVAEQRAREAEVRRQSAERGRAEALESGRAAHRRVAEAEARAAGAAADAEGARANAQRELEALRQQLRAEKERHEAQVITQPERAPESDRLRPAPLQGLAVGAPSRPAVCLSEIGPSRLCRRPSSDAWLTVVRRCVCRCVACLASPLSVCLRRWRRWVCSCARRRSVRRWVLLPSHRSMLLSSCSCYQ
jgi:hypothetical protein